MSVITEKVAYLKGLLEGLELNEKDKETKLFVQIIEILDEMAFTMEDMEERQAELEEVVDDIDEDLAAVEDELYEGCDCGCEDDDDFVEVECPHCGETVFFDASALEEPELACPNCNELIYEDEEEIDD
ncbi:phage terminase large subunit family protein [Clostridia bacterium OttesenSCG-928-F22]|nr:phage terminase large subunit family protein [Clostridia bacterium OttesenSCG-928-F22]